MGGRLLWPTGPPFDVYPVAPDALITTEGFLPCSAATPLLLLLPAPWGPPCTVVLAPFNGASIDFAFWLEAPAGAADIGVAVLVAFAYDLTGSCAGTAPGCDDVVLGVEDGCELATAVDRGFEGGCAFGVMALVIRGLTVTMSAMKHAI